VHLTQHSSLKKVQSAMGPSLAGRYSKSRTGVNCRVRGENSRDEVPGGSKTTIGKVRDFDHSVGRSVDRIHSLLDVPKRAPYNRPFFLMSLYSIWLETCSHTAEDEPWKESWCIWIMHASITEGILMRVSTNVMRVECRVQPLAQIEYQVPSFSLELWRQNWRTIRSTTETI
jgi:hypothetical protein